MTEVADYTSTEDLCPIGTIVTDRSKDDYIYYGCSATKTGKFNHHFIQLRTKSMHPDHDSWTYRSVHTETLINKFPNLLDQFPNLLEK